MTASYVYALLLTGFLLSRHPDGLFGQNSEEKTEKISIAVLPYDNSGLFAGQSVPVKSTGDDGRHSAIVESREVFLSDKEALAFADAAFQKTVQAFVQIKRIRVIERAAIEKVIDEQNLQLSDLSAGDEPVKAGSLMGADYLLIGGIRKLSLIIHPDTSGAGISRDGYIFEGQVTLNFRLISVATGEVSSANEFKGRTGFLYQGSPIEAAYKALDGCGKDMKEWLKSVFPNEGAVYEIRKMKKGEARELMITCGSASGVRKGDIFRVYTETVVDIGGVAAKKSTEIGKLTVKKTEQDGLFSICEVNKGGRKIAEQFRAGAVVKVIQLRK